MSSDYDDDFVADRHVDLDAGEYGGMADADYYDRISGSRRDAGEPIPEELRGAPDPEVARIQRNMDLLCGLPDDPFAEEG